MRKHAVALIVGSALLMWSTSASALAYTISSSVGFSLANGTSGTINPVTDLSGTSICLGGTTCSNPVAQDWLLVSVTLDGASAAASEIGISAIGVTGTLGVTGAVGVGHFSDPNETPTGGAILTADAGLVRYDFPNASVLNLEALETSDRLFVAFNPVGSLPGPGIPFVFPPGTASFMIRNAATGITSSVQGSIVLVPEPGTLLLVGGGLLGLGLAGRRRRF